MDIQRYYSLVAYDPTALLMYLFARHKVQTRHGFPLPHQRTSDHQSPRSAYRTVAVDELRPVW